MIKIAYHLIVASLFVTAALAQVGREVLLSGTENAYNPVPSPDGKLIAYVRTGWGRLGGSGGFGRSNLRTGVAVITASGQSLSAVPASAFPLVDAFLYGWTPDGTKLICYRDWHFYLVGPTKGIAEDGHETGGDEKFARSERVAYLSKSHTFVWVEHRRPTLTMLLTGEGTLAENSALTGNVVVPSPDERFIAVAGNGMDLWVYDTAQKKWADLGKVTIHPGAPPDIDWDYIKPRWNPWFSDSSHLVFFSNSLLVITTPDGTRRQVIFTSKDAAGLAVPSPDGSRVAYATLVPRPVKLRPDLKFWGGSMIWTLPVAGGKPQPITSKSDDSTYDLQWAGNHRLVFDRISDEPFYWHSRLWAADVP